MKLTSARGKLGAIVRRTTAAARRTYDDTMKWPGPHVETQKPSYYYYIDPKMKNQSHRSHNRLEISYSPTIWWLARNTLPRLRRSLICSLSLCWLNRKNQSINSLAQISTNQNSRRYILGLIRLIIYFGSYEYWDLWEFTALLLVHEKIYFKLLQNTSKWF